MPSVELTLRAKRGGKSVFAKHVTRLTPADDAMCFFGEFLNLDKPIDLPEGAVIVAREYVGFGSQAKLVASVFVVTEKELVEVISTDDGLDWYEGFEQVRSAVGRALADWEGAVKEYGTQSD